MSYKDLEDGIRQMIQDELHKARQKELDKQRKAFKKAKNKRVPMYIPERPLKYEWDVEMNLRKMSEGLRGELYTITYTVDTMGETDAEIKAVKKARDDGYMWRGTVSIKRKF